MDQRPDDCIVGLGLDSIDRSRGKKSVWQLAYLWPCLGSLFIGRFFILRRKTENSLQCRVPVRILRLQ